MTDRAVPEVNEDDVPAGRQWLLGDVLEAGKDVVDLRVGRRRDAQHGVTIGHPLRVACRPGSRQFVFWRRTGSRRLYGLGRVALEVDKNAHFTGSSSSLTYQNARRARAPAPQFVTRRDEIGAAFLRSCR
jgi:hypothetical protein